jgi:hypothetical protein
VVLTVTGRFLNSLSMPSYPCLVVNKQAVFIKMLEGPTGCATSFHSSGIWLESILPRSPGFTRLRYFSSLLTNKREH